MNQDSFLTALLAPATDNGGGTIFTTRPKIAPLNYLCIECLSSFTTEEKLATGKTYRPNAECVCGSTSIEYLGQAALDKKRLEKNAVRAICDARCTNASGPSCDCQCGGANHGSQLVVTVRIDAGPIPKIESKNPQFVAKAKHIREDFNGQIATLEQNLAVYWGQGEAEKFKLREPMSHPAAWAAFSRVYRAIHHAKEARSHTHRMKILREVNYR